MRLFTKEDVLDGEERPVRSLTHHTTVDTPFVKVIYGLFSSSSSSRISLPSLCFSPRPATDAKPEGNAPKDSASRSSLRSSCFVSFAHVLFVSCIAHRCIWTISINNRNGKLMQWLYFPLKCSRSTNMTNYEYSKLHLKRQSVVIFEPVLPPWLGVPLRPEAFLRLQQPSQQTLHFRQLPPQRARPAGVRLGEQRWVSAKGKKTNYRPRRALSRLSWTLMTEPCLSLPAERAVYNLYAVSNHSGNALGGHYTAYCRNPALGEWYSYNDTRYHQITSYCYQFHHAVCTCYQIIDLILAAWRCVSVLASVLHWLREGM